MKNKILSYVLFLSFGFMTVQCDSYLDTSSPEKTGDKCVMYTRKWVQLTMQQQDCRQNYTR